MIPLRVERAADAEHAARACARHIAASARRAVAARGACTVALSGGRTPAPMLAVLAAEPLPWPRIHVFQVDERIAPAGDPARNIDGIRRALVAPSRLPRGQLHAMPVDDDDLERAQDGYARELSQAAGDPPRLDIVHLGLGDDGHTASLVPGDRALAAREGPLALTAEYRGHRRMTLTFATIDRARERVWLVSGADKAQMLARLLAGDGAIPAGRVRRDDSIVFADEAAGCALH